MTKVGRGGKFGNKSKKFLRRRFIRHFPGYIGLNFQRLGGGRQEGMRRKNFGKVAAEWFLKSSWMGCFRDGRLGSNLKVRIWDAGMYWVNEQQRGWMDGENDLLIGFSAFPVFRGNSERFQLNCRLPAGLAVAMILTFWPKMKMVHWNNDNEEWRWRRWWWQKWRSRCM